MNEDNKTIFRIVKNADNPFAMIDRRVLEAPAMSWAAKGLLAYLLSRPDNWTIQMEDLIKRSDDGKDATRSALNELLTAGHLIRTEIREKGRFMRLEYAIHENPVEISQRTLPKARPVKQAIQEQKHQEPDTDLPLPGFPETVKPDTENPPLNNTDLNDIKNIGDKSPKVGTGEKPAPPPTWDLGWQLTRPGPVILPTDEERAAAELADALNLFRQDERPLVQAFITATQIFPIRADLAYWRKSLTYLREKGVTPDHLRQAAGAARAAGLTIASPKSLEKQATSLLAEQKAKAITQASPPLSDLFENFKPRSA